MDWNFSGSRSEGYAFVGDITGGLGICLHDFWQSYPSTIEISDAKSETAVLTAWLWSPETEPMDLRHYDNVSHTLSASYEDVQEGMSTPYGISRTSTLTFIPQTGYSGRKILPIVQRSLPEWEFCYRLLNICINRKLLEYGVFLIVVLRFELV